MNVLVDPVATHIKPSDTFYRLQLKLGVVVQPAVSATWETEVGGSQVLGQSELHTESSVFLGSRVSSRPAWET